MLFNAQGCMASTEFSQESIDPLRTAVIPSSEIKHGCQGIYLAIYPAIYL